MLSNINELHEIEIDKRLKRELDIVDFRSNYFDKVYYSHLIGMRKPDAEIYSFVHGDLGVTPSDILFIDDLESNIEAAKEAGWNGVVHSPNNDIINDLDMYIYEAFN